MIDNYEPEYWWFECFDFLRRLALTGLMVLLVPGSALQGFIGVLIALGGLIAYLEWKPFIEDASDWVAVSCQISTFFVFLSALMIQVNAVSHRKGFAALLSVVTLVPAFISMCVGFRAFRVAWKEESADSSSSEAPVPGKDHAANPESSPTSPLEPDAPPQEEPTLDVEQPIETANEAP